LVGFGQQKELLPKRGDRPERRERTQETRIVEPRIKWDDPRPVARLEDG
jgi:hypothetical protein